MSSRTLPILFLASLAPALLAGCPDNSHDCGGPIDAMPGVPDGGHDSGVCQGDTSPTRKLDLLFLIDNSGSMGEEQASLAANFPQFMSVLENIQGGLPDLHVGVISSNMGVGGFNITGCTGVGDDGALQHQARIMGCAPPSGAFIADEIAADGHTRVKNYTGTLSDTFSCISQLGTLGCGFEQHLASLERALDPTNLANAGFLRPDAYLAVIIVADEDDCSAHDPEIYDPNVDTSLTGVLGPLESFRCTEFGITCDEGNLTRSAASYTGCRPRTDSPYLVDPKHVAEFLSGIKCDPNKLILSGILGNSTPVSVGLSNGKPQLRPSCSSTSNGTADPAVRMSWLLDQFPGSIDTSICNNDLSAALQSIAEKLAGSVGP
jgi:hypothetical protein